MKQYFFCLSLLLLSVSSIAQTHRKCNFQAVIEKLEKHHKYDPIKATQSEIAASSKSDTVITIPVVFHIIWKYPHQNLSEAQIYSQIDVLNEDYRRQNNNLHLVNLPFTAADVKIEFCLAKVDPLGQYTHGITRTQTNQEDIGINNTYFNIKPAWNRDEYLNIWVGDFGNNIAGQAYPPGSPANLDGVMIDYTNFGRVGNLQSPYDLGRTLTHEVGHWLGLYHPWGLNPSCSNDDLVSDTPNQSEIYYGCPGTKFSCNTLDNTANFMGYVDDGCMAHFSQGQKSRMRNVLLNQRAEITRSLKGCNAVGLKNITKKAEALIYPNPSNGVFNLEFSTQTTIDSKNIILYDLNGRKVNCLIEKNGEAFKIDFANPNNGLYFLEIQLKGKRVLKKLIINN